MFISKGCLWIILENLSVLNKEVGELKKAVNYENKSKQTARQDTNHLKSH